MFQEGGNQKFLSFRDKSIKEKNFNISTRLPEWALAFTSSWVLAIKVGMNS